MRLCLSVQGGNSFLLSLCLVHGRDSAGPATPGNPVPGTSQVPGNVRLSKRQTRGLRRGTQSPAKSNREGLFKLFSVYVDFVRRQREVG